MDEIKIENLDNAFLSIIKDKRGRQEGVKKALAVALDSFKNNGNWKRRKEKVALYRLPTEDSRCSITVELKEAWLIEASEIRERFDFNLAQLINFGLRQNH